MTVTPDKEIEIAVRAAKVWAARNQPQFEWRDVLSHAWMGVSRANRKGQEEGILATAGICSIMSALKVERPVRGADPRAKRLGVSVSTIPTDDEYTAPEPTPTDAERINSLWYDTRPQRENWSWKQRIYLNLWAVEGWTQYEIADYFGVTHNTVSQTVARAQQRIRRGETC